MRGIAIRRPFAVLIFLVGLPGCNMVVSVDPWFSDADSQSAPVLREGLWLRAEDDCVVDTAQPPEHWPECADAMIIRGREWFGMDWEEAVDPRRFVGWERQPILLANGEPLIVQLQGEKPAPTSEPGDVPWQYLYAALRPTEFDERGTVMAYQSWGIQCGPKPEDDPSKPELSGVTEQPFPGLRIAGDNCLAENVDALRRAALLSETLGEISKSRWVRDAVPGG